MPAECSVFYSDNFNYYQGQLFSLKIMDCPKSYFT